MGFLLLGLVLFLGVHSVRIVADGWRTQMRARLADFTGLIGELLDMPKLTAGVTAAAEHLSADGGPAA